MKRFRNCDHLCSYVGLVPTLYSSDETEYVGNLTPRGNTYVLPILIECTWAAVGKDPALMNAYHQLCKRMKGQDAIIRIARKLLRRIRHVLMHETPYELNTVSQCIQLSRWKNILVLPKQVMTNLWNTDLMISLNSPVFSINDGQAGAGIMCLTIVRRFKLQISRKQSDRMLQKFDWWMVTKKMI